ncbi:hypothetical protein Tco_0540151 [Tanacetum coccineum]
MVSTVKLLILKKGEYTLWSMRMEQYLTNTDYSLWQVILNGDSPIQVTTDEKGVKIEVPPKTAQALLQRQSERKAKSILLLAIPDEYQLRFHGIKDAKFLLLRSPNETSKQQSPTNFFEPPNLEKPSNKPPKDTNADNSNLWQNCSKGGSCSEGYEDAIVVS